MRGKTKKKENAVKQRIEEGICNRVCDRQWTLAFVHLLHSVPLLYVIRKFYVFFFCMTMSVHWSVVNAMGML